MDIIVGLGEYAISNKEDDVIKTYALSSCIGITVYSPMKKVAGLAHIVLPTPHQEENETSKPVYYASTGVPLLLEKLYAEFQCSKHDLIIKIFGGANSQNEQDFFKIGRQNLVEVTKILENLGVLFTIADTGGNVSRTIEIAVSTGHIKILKQKLNV